MGAFVGYPDLRESYSIHGRVSDPGTLLGWVWLVRSREVMFLPNVDGVIVQRVSVPPRFDLSP